MSLGLIKPPTRRSVEKMKPSKIRLQRENVASSQAEPLAQCYDQIICTRSRDDQGLCPRGLDHHDFGVDSAIANGNVFGPDTVNNLSSTRDSQPTRQWKASSAIGDVAATASPITAATSRGRDRIDIWLA